MTDLGDKGQCGINCRPLPIERYDVAVMSRPPPLPRSLRTLGGYALIVLVLGGLTLLLDRLETLFGPALLVPYVLVVALAGRWGGLGAAIFACIASIPLVDYYLLEPTLRPELFSRQSVQLGLVLLAGLLLGWLLNRLELARERAELHAAAERSALDERDALLRIIAHDLRSPLTAIKARVQLAELALRREPADVASALHSLATALPQVDRVNRLLDDLQAIGRPDGAFSVQFVPLDLAHQLARIAERWRTDAPSHRFEVQTAESLPASVDAARIEQVLDNLLANAVKYSPAGSQIRLSGWLEGDEVRLAVTDNGTGIPADEQGRIFERFYRRGTDLEGRRPGLGLGLYIARELMQAQLGRLWVESDGQHGSTFILALPRQQSQPEPVNEAPQRSPT
jgi:signal transduction histidine kinase